MPESFRPLPDDPHSPHAESDPLGDSLRVTKISRRQHISRSTEDDQAEHSYKLSQVFPQAVDIRHVSAEAVAEVEAVDAQQQTVEYLEQVIDPEVEVAVAGHENGLSIETDQVNADVLATSLSVGMHTPQPSQTPLQQWVERDQVDAPNMVHVPLDIHQSLDDLRHLSGPEKAEAIEQLRRDYIKGRHNAAMLQESLIAMVDQDPELDQQALQQYFTSEAERLGLSELEAGIGQYVLDQFGERRAEIQELYDTYPDDLDLYKHHFKVDQPWGEIEITRRPFNIDIACHDARDYAYLVQFETNIYYGLPTDDIEPDVDKFGKSSGMYSFGMFTFRNLTSTKRSPQSTKDHETQHAQYQVLRSSLSIESAIYQQENKRALAEFGKHNSLETWQSSVKQLLRNFRYEFIDPQVKNELLAYSVEENVQPAVIYQELTKVLADGGLYDYITHAQNADRLTLIAKLLLASAIKDEQLADKEDRMQQLQDTVFITDYRMAIAMGLEVLDNLNHGLGYSQQQVVALLTHEELHNWPKLEHRLMRQMIEVGALDEDYIQKVRAARQAAMATTYGEAAGAKDQDETVALDLTNRPESEIVAETA